MMLVGMDLVVGLLGYITLVIFKNYHEQNKKKFLIVVNWLGVAPSRTIVLC